VVLTVVDTERLASERHATNTFKPAKMETGITVQVPPFIKTRARRSRSTPTEGTYMELCVALVTRVVKSFLARANFVCEVSSITQVKNARKGHGRRPSAAFRGGVVAAMFVALAISDAASPDRYEEKTHQSR